MNTPLNLKELERKAYRSFYQDGIWDIFFGLMMLAMYAFTLFDYMENKALRMLVMLFIEIEQGRTCSRTDGVAGTPPLGIRGRDVRCRESSCRHFCDIMPLWRSN